jgi:hypothetical protein
MEASRGIDGRSGADDVRDAFEREGVDLRLEQRDGRWVAVAVLHGREQWMGAGVAPDEAARDAWQRHLAVNEGVGES